MRTRVQAGLVVLGLAGLAFLLGAAVMFFELPGADFLAKAFGGALAWYERRQALAVELDPRPPTIGARAVDYPDKTFDGFTLYTTASMHASSTQAFLVNMRREVVHRWSIRFSAIWPDPPHALVRVDDSLACFFSCRLFPNGDLLVVLQGLQQLTNGYGLVKLDKDSQVLWKYAGNVHHDVDVGEDGTIYAIQHELVQKMPPGLEFVPVPCLVDAIVTLSPDGQPLGKPVSILTALRDSPYAAMLGRLARGGQKDPAGQLNKQRLDDAIRKQDALHANYVEVLRSADAPKFPAFKAGQVLISLRHLDAIGVLDLEKATAVWAAHGPWLQQHDPHFLENGRLLLFDNLGSPKGSRVLEYDPQTQAVQWVYAGENRPGFFTKERGMCQRLPNGNTLIVNSDGGEIFEVTRDREVVWSCPLEDRVVPFARRYAPAGVAFLKGNQHARPR